MQAIRLGVLGAVLVAGLPACSYLGLSGEDGMFRDREADYLEAPNLAPMAIPSDLDSYTLDELFVIPPPPANERAYFVRAPLPNPLDTSIREGVVVQRFGDRRWVVVGAEPAQVWPRLRDYWTNAQIPVATEDPINAIITTQWIGEEGSRNKYQTRIEPGLHSGNSEVYVIQISESFVQDIDAPITWPDESQSLELEHEMLDRVSVYLADRTDLYRASSVSLLAGSLESASKARVERSAAGSVLHMQIDFDRAWSQISQSLGNANIEVLNSDRDEGVFQVSYAGEIDEEDRPGFFARLFRRGNNEIDAKVFTVTLTTGTDEVSLRATGAVDEESMALQELLIRTLHTNLI